MFKRLLPKFTRPIIQPAHQASAAAYKTRSNRNQIHQILNFSKKTLRRKVLLQQLFDSFSEQSSLVRINELHFHTGLP